MLRKGGYLAATASPPDEALAKARRVGASFVFHQSDAARLAKLLGMVDAGTLKVLVDRVVPTNELAQAFACQASGHARGKVIVTLQPQPASRDAHPQRRTPGDDRWPRAFVARVEPQHDAGAVEVDR